MSGISARLSYSDIKLLVSVQTQLQDFEEFCCEADYDELLGLEAELKNQARDISSQLERATEDQTDVWEARAKKAKWYLERKIGFVKSSLAEIHKENRLKALSARTARRRLFIEVALSVLDEKDIKRIWSRVGEIERHAADGK